MVAHPDEEEALEGEGSYYFYCMSFVNKRYGNRCTFNLAASQFVLQQIENVNNNNQIIIIKIIQIPTSMESNCYRNLN